MPAGGEEDFEGVAVLDDQDDAAQPEGDGSGSGSGPNDGAHGLDAEVDVAHLSFNPSPLSLGTVVAPQGMAYEPTSETLYVADSQSDQVVALKGANTSTGPITPKVLLKGGPLHTPQGLAIDPSTGNLLVVNGAVDNTLTELSIKGKVISTRNLDPTGAPGALFGLTATQETDGNTLIYYVNDNTNTLHQLTDNNVDSDNHEQPGNN